MALTFDDAVAWNNTGTNNYYSGVRYNGVLCEVITSYHPESFGFSGLLMVTVGSTVTYYPAQRVDDYVYYISGTTLFKRAYNGVASNEGSLSITSQSPSNYVYAITQGIGNGFTLEAFE